MKKAMISNGVISCTSSVFGQVDINSATLIQQLTLKKSDSSMLLDTASKMNQF